ncbi:hypothetical protein BD410DRAFT_809550 [Rickenella mellea]|uniref:Uncharacterized protein n=1 Tax=Rickenella mellea TaxID=50990 RepID=A0A4Y7PJE6_9AGAM|nr:hypothetical protein BD410DRAFT_809550 [Rickenella mellea]
MAYSHGRSAPMEIHVSSIKAPNFTSTLNSKHDQSTRNTADERNDARTHHPAHPKRELGVRSALARGRGCAGRGTRTLDDNISAGVVVVPVPVAACAVGFRACNCVDEEKTKGLGQRLEGEGRERDALLAHSSCWSSVAEAMVEADQLDRRHWNAVDVQMHWSQRTEQSSSSTEGRTGRYQLWWMASALVGVLRENDSPEGNGGEWCKVCFENDEDSTEVEETRDQSLYRVVINPRERAQCEGQGNPKVAWECVQSGKNLLFV